MVVLSQYNSYFSENLNNSFYWFEKVLLIKLKERIRGFLLNDYGIKTVGICEKDNSSLFNGEEYFVTRIKIDTQKDIFFRISAKLMDSILTATLGGREEDFTTDSLTELEGKILTTLNDYIYKGIAPFLVKNQTDENAANNPNYAHITFMTKDKRNINGKFIISVPISLLPVVRAATPTQNFDMDSFPKYKVPVNILCGKSELTLYDIQHIEAGDIVVLEQSNIKQMVIEIDGKTKGFRINPETSIITGIDNNNEGAAQMADNTGNMWDVIPVEISAEFENVSITLGELKKISEGTVVDIGTIYENKIYIKVENKPIALGELIIINDKYAVRINEVLTGNNNQQQPAPVQQQPVQQQAQAAPPPPQQEAQQENEDFNDFDIEDEDI